MCCGARVAAVFLIAIIVIDLGIVLLAAVILAFLVGVLMAAWEEWRAR